MGLFQSLRPALAAGLLLLASTASAGRGDTSRAERDASTYAQLESFARVLSYVENNYVEPADREKLMRGAIKGMLETLDPHTVYMPPEVFREMKIDTSGEFGGLGIEVAVKDNRLVVVAPIDDTPAARAGLKPGDQILRIDGEDTQGMELARALQKMRGPAGQKVLLTILREGFSAPRDIAILRDHIRIISVEGALHGGYGYVKLKNFQERTDLDLRKELARLRGLNGGKELKGLVLDLRNNPGGLLEQAVAVSDRFLPGNLLIVSTRGRDGRNVIEEHSKARDTERPYPMVVLVNAGSASASEIVAGALQDHGRAVILGTPTFGKGSVQTVIEMEDGSGLKLTIARYYTPRGRSIQERGILPDFLVPEVAEQEQAALREKDLERHFRAEPTVGAEPATPAEPAPRRLPPLKDWSATEKLEDVALKAALNYLHAGPPARPPARPEAAEGH